MPDYTLKNRIYIISLSLLILALASGCFLSEDSTNSADEKKYDAATLAGINNIFEEVMQKESIPGILACVWNDGYETLLITKGKADTASGRDVKNNDSFRIASNTKMFTAMAVLMLADQKKIALDEKLSKYLPDIPHAEKVSIRQLADHTAGYHNYTAVNSFGLAVMANPLKKWTPQELIDVIKDKPLDFVPGEKYNYSNTGYIILGMLVEKVSGVKWENFITEKILKPLMMNDTYCPLDSNMSGEYMNGYVVEGTRAVQITVDPSVAWAAGSIVSNISDTKKWLEALRQGTLISPAMLAEQRKWIPTETGGTENSYGFGLMMSASQFIGHTGGILGYNSFMFISLDGRKCVIIIHNVQAGIDESSSKIIKYLGLKNY